MASNALPTQVQSSEPAPARADRGELLFRRVGAVGTALLLACALACVVWLLITARAQANALPAAMGSLLSSSLTVGVPAVVMAVVIAYLVALFVSAYCPPRWRSRARTGVELLAALPSVIWAIAAAWIVMPLVEDTFGPQSARSWCIGILCVLCIAPLTRAFLGALRRVPAALGFAAQALGSTTFDVQLRVILPYVAPDVCRFAAVALVRAVGEGATLLMLLGPVVASSSVGGWLAVSSFQIGTPSANLRAGLAEGALGLLAVSGVLLVVSHWLGRIWRRPEEAV